jgi:hypothetical protein
MYKEEGMKGEQLKMTIEIENMNSEDTPTHPPNKIHINSRLM